MKAKKAISLILCMVMIFALAVPALAAEDVKFTDVPDGYWAKDSIYLVAKAGIVGGYGNGYFGPENNITREQFAKVVANFMGYTEKAELNFSDVDPNSNLTPYVAMCVKAGVINGYPDGTFKPKAYITREAAATMLCRAFKLDTTGMQPKFTDSASIDDVFKASVAAMNLTEVIAGYPSGEFRPKANLTRAQMMVMISRLLVTTEEKVISVAATAGDANLSLNVFTDNSTQLYIPNNEVSTAKVTVSVVPGEDLKKLGMTETSAEYETGVDGKFSPRDMFSAAYDYNFATVKASVNGKDCTFNVYGQDAEGGRLITSTPTDSAKADAAMQELVSVKNFFMNLLKTGNSVTLANGSYIQIGTERLGFKDDVKDNLTIDNTADPATIAAAIEQCIDLKTGVQNDGNEFTVVIKKGTSVATEKGTVTLIKDITVTANGAGTDFDGILSKLLTADESDAGMLIGLANEIIAAIDGHVVYVNVTIK